MFGFSFVWNKIGRVMNIDEGKLNIYLNKLLTMDKCKVLLVQEEKMHRNVR
jgi:hypothetical protein